MRRTRVPRRCPALSRRAWRMRQRRRRKSTRHVTCAAQDTAVSAQLDPHKTITREASARQSTGVCSARAQDSCTCTGFMHVHTRHATPSPQAAHGAAEHSRFGAAARTRSGSGVRRAARVASCQSRAALVSRRLLSGSGHGGAPCAGGAPSRRSSPGRLIGTAHWHRSPGRLMAGEACLPSPWNGPGPDSQARILSR